MGLSRKMEEELDRWSKEIRRGAVPLTILALVNKSPAYGYELVKQLEDTTSFIQLEQGTVYPLLRRLEKRGILRSEWNYNDPTKPRKYYRLTPDGEKTLTLMVQSWIQLSEEMKEILTEVKQHDT
jgi:DNA-binding PadR family transcriptional regulator